MNTEQDILANRHLKAIKALRDELQTNVEIAAREMERILNWLDGERVSLDKQIHYHEEQLKQLALSYDFGEKKSRRLPFGTFGFRKSRARLEVVDDDAAKEWARREGILKVETVEKYNKKDLLACVETRGEIPDGCEYHPGQEQFYVKEQTDEA